MGLFDNLFLDQNTPVLINDGTDHSKDVVTEIIPPTPQGGDSSGKGDDGSTATNPQNPETKHEEGFDALFEEEKIKPVVDVPAPAVEFKLSPETIGAPSGNPEVPSMSFDIGGDMSFDIGGDVVGSNVSTNTISTPGTFLGNEVAQDAQKSEIVSDLGETAKIPDVSGEIAAAIPTIMEVQQDINNDKETDSALFSLLNDDTPSPEVAIDAIDTSAIEVPVAPSSEGISFLDTATPPLEIDIPKAVEKKEENIVESITPMTSVLESISIDDDITPTTIPSSSTSKLKSKLEEFIDELKALEAEDQEVKNKKRQQFEMFQVRAQEIKAEYDMRIRALELEEKALEEQISAMDNEKVRIKDMIRAFKVELEKA